MKNVWKHLAAVTVSLSFAASLSASPVFVFSGDVPSNVLTGFEDAAAAWASVLRDNVTININLGYTALDPGILGETGSTTYTVPYSTLKTALGNDITDSYDATAVSHLQTGNTLSFEVNHTTQCGDCSNAYVDSYNNSLGPSPLTGTIGNPRNANFDNQYVQMPYAEARALGLVSAVDSTIDGSITFSSLFSFDFDPSDGISSGQYDFVGIAEHEIGHLLGFVSSADDFDYSTAGTGLSEAAADPTVLDLFRYGNENNLGIMMDLSASGTPKYFSIDGGATLGSPFSTGVHYGDGRQASHWEDNMGLGVMDPTAAPGELLSISSNDIEALDVIGWNVAPEPGTVGLCLSALAALAWWQRKRTA